MFYLTEAPSSGKDAATNWYNTGKIIYYLVARQMTASRRGSFFLEHRTFAASKLAICKSNGRRALHRSKQRQKL